MTFLLAAAEATAHAADHAAESGLAAQFGLEVPKLIAQVIVFLVVFVVLNKFAFGPIMAMLEQRRRRIAEGEAKLDKIARDLAEAEKNAQALIDKANGSADRVIKDANEAAKSIAEKRQQEAVHEAGQILAKAREAAQLERDQVSAQLKREFGRMVADATSRVTGKVLNADDQNRLNQETAAQVSL